MRYADLPQVTKYYLHELELIAAYRFLKSLPLDNGQVQEIIFKNLGGSDAFPRWKYEVFEHLKLFQARQPSKSGYLLYYTVADAPMLTIMRNLKVSQAKMYQMRNTPPMGIVKKTILEGFFVDHPEVIPNLNRFVRKLRLFDGYYILGS